MKKIRQIFAFLICITAVLFFSACSKSNSMKSGFDTNEYVREESDESYEYDDETGKSEEYVLSADAAVKKTENNGDWAGQQQEIQAGLLTAGEWNDNINFTFFKNLLKKDNWNEYINDWNINPTMRYAVDTGIKNTRVILYDAQGNTLWSCVADAKGKAYLFYDVFEKSDNKPHKIVAEYEGKEESYIINGNETDEYIKIDLKTQGKEIKKLDLMFTIDTTGSMGDELEYLKKELQSVISAVADKNDGLQIRLSVNFYRDTQDEYVVRNFPFTDNINQAIEDLKAQSSDGGGDFPEAVDKALENSIFEHKWENESVKIMFLLLDAPAHYEESNVKESIAKSIKEAAKKGIRIIPIASSGVDESTEFSLRSLSALTGATYTFLTDHSGIGNSHLEPTIGQYKTEKLNELMTRLINEYCA